MNEEQNKEIVLKDPEELEWHEFINLLKIAAKEDNEKARKIAEEFIENLENDDGYFWKISDLDAMILFQYAGYTEEDDLVKLYDNLRSMERYNEYKERQKAIRKANMANSPLGRLKARVYKFLNPNEPQQDSPENTTNESNDGEAR